MSDPPPDTEPDPGRPYPGMPRWVKVTAIIAVGLLLLVVVVLVVGAVLGLHDPRIGPGGHSPGRDARSGQVGIHAPVLFAGEASATDAGQADGRTVPLKVNYLHIAA